MKKAAVFALVLALIVSIFAACGKPGTDPAGDTSGKNVETTPKAEDTTKKVEETTPKAEDTTKEAEVTEDPNATPTVRTMYGVDQRDKLTLLDHGVDPNLKIVNTLTAGKSFAVDATIDADGKLEAEVVDWNVIMMGQTSDAHTTNDGKHTYFPFVGFTEAVTVNELVIGDCSNWNPETPLFTDYGKLKVWYTDNPNGTWTESNWTASSFENPDNGLLWGTYAQGISFTGEDVTARYFIIWYPDPLVDEIYFTSNSVCPAVIYNPPAA
ncbi:MAG: hypothetical protein IKX86_02185 [Clostridia bacterium]|nr:hypothetical protein [Clostridia bacterium]